MNILSISDVIIPFIYSPQVRTKFAKTDLVIGCGDLPYYYQEFILNMLDVPLYFVRGNHDKRVEHGEAGMRSAPDGAIDLHRRVVFHAGYILAGVEGSLIYSGGDFQYSQAEMWAHVWSLVPRLLINRIVYGRYLDIFVTHAPPRGIHDREDLTHRGIDAFRWMIQTFRPAIYFHGHVHIYSPDEITETRIGSTRLINSYGFRETSVPDQRQIKTGLRASRKT
jgi:Icc-related predicted phosphoesterase